LRAPATTDIALHTPQAGITAVGNPLGCTQDWKSSVLAAGPPGYGQNSILNEEVQGFLLGHRILQGLPYELDPILTAR